MACHLSMPHRMRFFTLVRGFFHDFQMHVRRRRRSHWSISLTLLPMSGEHAEASTCSPSTCLVSHYFSASFDYSSTVACAAARQYWLSDTYRVSVKYWHLFFGSFCPFGSLCLQIYTNVFGFRLVFLIFRAEWVSFNKNKVKLESNLYYFNQKKRAWFQPCKFRFKFRCSYIYLKSATNSHAD